VDSSCPLTLRRIFAEPKYNLAAFGVAFALALVVEAPIIMIMSASTALVHDRQSYLKLRNYTHVLNAALTLAMVVLLIPRVFELVAATLIGLPPEVAGRTYVAVAILLPWPGTIGFRRFYQGVLIRSGRTRLVAYGTVIRLIVMAATCLCLWEWTGLEGAWVAAAALSAGVTAEALASRGMAHGVVRRLMDPLPGDVTGEPLSYASITHFYWPLALTTVLALGLHPVVTFFVGHGRAPLESLAVLPVVNSLVFIFRSLGLAFQEVGIALIGDDKSGYPALRRFAALLAVALTAGLSLIAWTPLATWWFQTVSGLSPDLARFALVPTRVLCLIPALTLLISLQRAVLVATRNTAPVTWATLIEVGAALVVLTTAVFALGVVGATAAAIALLIGRIGANLYLVPPVRGSLR